MALYGSGRGEFQRTIEKIMSSVMKFLKDVKDCTRPKLLTLRSTKCATYIFPKQTVLCNSRVIILRINRLVKHLNQKCSRAYRNRIEVECGVIIRLEISFIFHNSGIVSADKMTLCGNAIRAAIMI